MTNKNRLEELNLKVNSKIDNVLETAPKSLKEVISPLKQAKGKNIRAKVVISTALALDNYDESLIVNLGAAVELLHLATLIHDDVIDDAPLRRGYPTTQSVFGKRVAVIAGDYLFTQCFELITEHTNENMQYFSKAITLICVGEASQLENNMNLEITEGQYNNIIFGKTGAMFVLATYAIAKACEADDKTANALGRYGYYLGMIFQIIDDCLDFSGDEADVKKLLTKDLKDGVITLPLIFALEGNDELKKIITWDMKEDDYAKIVSEVKSSGSVDKARERAFEYYSIAKEKVIQAVGVEKAELLLNILEVVYSRNN